MANYICELQRQIIEFNSNKPPTKSDKMGEKIMHQRTIEITH